MGPGACVLTDICLVSAVLMVISSFLCTKKGSFFLTSFPYTRQISKIHTCKLSVSVYVPGVCKIKNISDLS